MGGYIYEAHFECHDIPMLGKNPIKWRQCPDMTIAVDWDVKHLFKQTNKITDKNNKESAGDDKLRNKDFHVTNFMEQICRTRRLIDFVRNVIDWKTYR